MWNSVSHTIYVYIKKEVDVLSIPIQTSAQSTSLSSWWISGFCLCNRIIVASITVQLNAMKSVATERNYKMNGKRVRQRIFPRSGSSPQSKATRRWRIMQNENVKEKKRLTLERLALRVLSPVPSMHLNICGILKRTFVWWDTSRPHLTPSH